MHATYGRDLDLNLLRVFVVVANAGSVTAAAAQLYLTQPAVSAALARLQRTVGTPLFARRGRGLQLTPHGQRLLQQAQPHLQQLVDATLHPTEFNAATTQRAMRLGLSDDAEVWLLPGLLRELSARAPGLQLIVRPVQFRTIAHALAHGDVELAVTVADNLPVTVRRETLFHGRFVCLFDPRHVRLSSRPTQAAYLQQAHAIVSYNGDLRGIIEDVFHQSRRIRCSVSSFANLGALVDGSALVATVPERVAHSVLATRPHLATCAVPFALQGSPIELLWPDSHTADPAHRFLRELIAQLSRADSPRGPRARAKRAASRGSATSRGR